MKYIDRISERASRGIAQRTSRRSFLSKLGAALVGASALPLLPIARAAAEVAPQSTGDPQDPGDPTPACLFPDVQFDHSCPEKTSVVGCG